MKWFKLPVSYVGAVILLPQSPLGIFEGLFAVHAKQYNTRYSENVMFEPYFAACFCFILTPDLPRVSS